MHVNMTETTEYVVDSNAQYHGAVDQTKTGIQRAAGTDSGQGYYRTTQENEAVTVPKDEHHAQNFKGASQTVTHSPTRNARIRTIEPHLSAKNSTDSA